MDTHRWTLGVRRKLPGAVCSDINSWLREDTPSAQGCKLNNRNPGWGPPEWKPQLQRSSPSSNLSYFHTKALGEHRSGKKHCKIWSWPWGLDGNSRIARDCQEGLKDLQHCLTQAPLRVSLQLLCDNTPCLKLTVDKTQPERAMKWNFCINSAAGICPRSLRSYYDLTPRCFLMYF